MSRPAPAPPVEVARSDRAKEVVAAARRLLEDEGPEALTIRRLAERPVGGRRLRRSPPPIGRSPSGIRTCTG